MKFEYQKSIDFLLENANPSIKLRVKKEILGSITAEEESALKSQIVQEKIICFMAEKQQENGWIGLGFHGSNKNAGQYDTKILVEEVIPNLTEVNASVLGDYTYYIDTEETKEQETPPAEEKNAVEEKNTQKFKGKNPTEIYNNFLKEYNIVINNKK